LSKFASLDLCLSLSNEWLYPTAATCAGRAHHPRSSKQPFDDPEWLFEFKYDGYRALCYIEEGRSRFISRNGNMLSRFRALGNEVAAELDVDEAILDGEVTAGHETGRPAVL
jgi:ATP-dependent DNA ligase